MKPATSRHSMHPGTLALALLALPYCGVFAAYNHSSTLTDASTLSPNLVTADTLAATGLDAVGTAEAPNTNYIGWAKPPTENVYLYWSTSGLTLSDLPRSSLVLGGSETASTSASSSYNSLTIGDYIELFTGDLIIGKGALGTGELANTVDATKLANGNSLTLTGAVYFPAIEDYVRSIVVFEGIIDIGHYGNDNTVSVTKGGDLMGTGIITLGASDANNPTFGCNNRFIITGKVTSDVIGVSTSANSTILAKGLVVGDYGSDNATIVSDSGSIGLLAGTGPFIKVGIHGDRNSLTITDGTAILDGDCTLGEMPSANDNSISLSNSFLMNLFATPITGLHVGVYGQDNVFEMTKSTLKTEIIRIGYGDDSNGDAALDETSGYEVDEGSDNRFLVTDSLIQMTGASSLVVGYYGSRNEANITGSGIYSDWTDAATSENPDGDGKVQFSEITAGIASISVGEGRNDSSIENSYAFGVGNSLTLSDTAAVTNTLKVGYLGGANLLTLAQGSVLHVKQSVTMGEGSADNPDCGKGNTITANDEGTLLKVDGGVNIGHYGSVNAFTVIDGADAVIKGGLTVGAGHVFSADIDTTNFGTSNLIGVRGEGSTLAITSGDPVYIGDYGSANRLSINQLSECTVTADNIIIGNAAVELGSILNSNKAYSEYNRISVSDATFRTNAIVTVGNLGRNNAMSVYGEKAYAEIGGLFVGKGNTSDPTFGSDNEVRVRDHAVLVTDALYIGSNGNGVSSGNLMQVLDASVVIVNGGFGVNNDYGSNNRIAIRNGIIALKGKGPESDLTWKDVIINGYPVLGLPFAPTSLVDAGAILVWDFTSGDFVTAKAADITLTYYSSEADALAATGYTGLAGYTILKQANDLSRLAWAGDVYDGGNGSYCSSWYGWFYNDATYGDYIFSYNNYAWQYIAPASTPENMNIYDYSLNSWLYTNSTEFATKRVYNYSKSAWMQLGE